MTWVRSTSGLRFFDFPMSKCFMCACVASRTYSCVWYTTFGVQVPPSARSDMEAFKERSLYPHIHARQADDYQACTYSLLLAY